MYPETEDCDLRFPLNIFKYDLPRGDNGVYNSLTIVSPYTIDKLMSRIDKYALVEDDEIATARRNDERKCGNKKFDNSKRKMKELNKVREDGYKGVNIVFTKSIHKIMFDIQHRLFLSGLGQWGATLTQEIPSSDVPTIKDHGHRTKNYKTLKRFLEGLVTKGHMDEYIKKGETTRKDYDDEEDEKPVKRPANNVVVFLIEAIHGTTN